MAYANPQGGTVSAGQATISQSGNTLNITQTTNKAVIDWRGFDINSGETTQFSQPSGSAIALNRVNSNSASQINGTLTANGNVIILNQNGVMFGAGSQVDVNGLIATTAGISNNDFMNAAGPMYFNIAGNPNATITNNGAITAGLVGIVAPNVINNGVITANLGKVQLSSGDTATIDLYGDNLMQVAVSDQVKSQLVSNNGLIEADGGRVALTAAAGNQIVNSLITIPGEIKTPAVAQQNGEIIIYAEGSNAVQNNVAANKGQKAGSSEVLVSGTLDASGAGSGQTGGTIQILGDHVAVLSGANVNVSGDAGGGTIQVGGNFHGQGATPTAQATIVQSGTNINADATNNGDGGKVEAVWSDGQTTFEGTISAKAGPNGGDGGFVETSGHYLIATGSVTAAATHGAAGMWLLDPNDILIDQSSCTGTSCSSADTISTTLSGGTNVTVTTADGAITLDNNVPIISTNNSADTTLTLSAGTDVIMNTGSAITGNGSKKLNVVFGSNTASGGGAISIAGNITTNGGDITLGTSLHPGAGDTGNHAGITINGSTLNAGGGNISMVGVSAFFVASGYGIWITNGSTVETTGSGTISMTGISIGNGGSSSGIMMDNSGDLISAQNGNITLDATGSPFSASISANLTAGTLQTTGSGSINITGETQGSTGGSNYSVRITNTIEATGSGNISIIAVGDGNSSTANNYGIYISGGGNVTTAGGNISLNGHGGWGTDTNYGVYLSSGGATVSTTGNGTILRTASGYGTGTNGYGFFMDDASDLVSTQDGTLTINGTGALSGSGASSGVVINAGVVKTTGSGNISVTGIIGGGASSYGISDQIANGLETTGTGSIAVSANSYNIGAANAINSAANLTITAHTASTTIGVGTNATGTLNFTDAELGDLTYAGTLTIGNTSTGAIDINTGSTIANKSLTIISGGTITLDKSGDTSPTALTDSGSGNTTLTLQAGTDIITAGAITNSGTGTLNVLMDADYALGGGAITIGGGITTLGGNVTLGGGNGVISAGTGYAVGDAYQADGIYINATVNAGAGNIIVNGHGYDNAAAGSNIGVQISSPGIVQTSTE